MATHEPPPPTVLAHKAAFLSAQTLQLSQPLAPSHAWQRNNTDSASSSGTANTQLSQKTLDDALFRLNHLLQQHSRRVYAPQATRHVAEQIERLLLDSADRYITGQQDDQEDGDQDSPSDALHIGSDLTNDEIISSLPSTWTQVHPSQASAHPEEAERYQALASSLNRLSARRAQAQQRVDRLRRMKALLRPFSPDQQTASLAGGGGGDHDDHGRGLNSSIQENLVTRNGDVENELERMRMLLVRVSGRLAQLPSATTTADDENIVPDLDVVERKKVQTLLDSF